MGKIISKEAFKRDVRPQLKQENKTIALCHGVFDLVHPGHIIHFEQAKQMADVLVVSVTSAEFVRKGPGRPYFNNEMRLKFLSEIGCIDYVMLSEGYTVDDIVESVEPDYYVKGEEYAREDEDITGKITQERELVERHGGKVAYTTGQVFSSTKLINNALSGLPEDVRAYMEEFCKKYSMEDVKKYAAQAEELNVLVIGDVIIDKYSYCDMQGVMSKDTGYSVKLKNTEQYMGGVLAIARHLSSFAKNVTVMSIVGNEEPMTRWIEDSLSDTIKLDLLHSNIYPTIVKQRYLMRNAKREEYKKIFAVNNIPSPAEYENGIKEEFTSKLLESIKDYDAVFLCDFGHGLIDDRIADIIQGNAKFIALNCQTNSANYGLNIITKYKRADVFALDQKELKLAFPKYLSDERLALGELCRHLSGNGWLTRGSSGAYGIDEKDFHECPAFTLTVKDTVGAGDAFFALAGIYAAAGAPVELCTFIGNVGGALGANIVGNKEAVEKVNVLKYASTLMNI